jgi:hypothetical protein
METRVGRQYLSGCKMRILAWAGAALRRLPRSSEVLADFSRLVEGDGSWPNVERCLEDVLRRSLKRTVTVVPVDAAPKDETRMFHKQGAWHTDRRAIAAWVESGRWEAAGASKLGGVFGEGRERIAALVPVTSSTGLRLATVVVGKRRFVALSDSERSLIAAAVGTATLLFEQARLRSVIDVATEAETVRYIAAKHVRTAKRHLDIDGSKSN